MDQRLPIDDVFHLTRNVRTVLLETPQPPSHRATLEPVPFRRPVARETLEKHLARCGDVSSAATQVGEALGAIRMVDEVASEKHDGESAIERKRADVREYRFRSSDESEHLRGLVYSDHGMAER